MKKIIFILAMLGSFNANAMSSDALRGTIVCGGGYKFLVVYSVNGNQPTVTQITGQVTHTNTPQPIKCDGTEKKLYK